MKTLASYRFIFSILWIGFLLAISFMEAPMKFQAELVTLPIGLSIGRLIFGLLNKIEWVLLGLIMASELLGLRSKASTAGVFVLLSLLIAQSFWLLPILDSRAISIINGGLPPGSNTHFYYLALEVIKLAGLVIYTRIALGLFMEQVLKPKTYSMAKQVQLTVKNKAMLKET